MSHKTSKPRKSVEPKIDSSFSLKQIQPITECQKDVIESFEEGQNLVLMGTAGTGKTFLSLYLALNQIIKGKGERPSKIMIIRSIVSSRDIGFLPGTIKEKMAVYEEPYRGIFSELFGRGDAYEVLKNKGIVEFCSTSYLRGTTLNNTFVILDEFQNCNYEEIRTILTRLGKNTRIFLCGDTRQNDLYRSKYDVSGMEEIVSVLETMKEFDIIDFGVEDIVRSDIVKSFIIAEEEYLKNKKT
mgnify:FL=1